MEFTGNQFCHSLLVDAICTGAYNGIETESWESHYIQIQFVRVCRME